MLTMTEILELYEKFYALDFKLYKEEKTPENFFSYRSFEIKKFRGLEQVSLNFSKNDLILLLGLNESGKMSYSPEIGH